MEGPVLDVRTIGLSDFWTFGFSDFRTSGLPDFWTFGLSDFRTYRIKKNHLHIWNLKSAHLYFYRHSLSRTFCHLMCRRDVITTGQPELDQVGKLTGVDISHFYAMNDFPDEEGLEFFISMAGSEEEKQSILTNAANSKAKLQGNIGTITDTINQLIEKLTPINNLPTLLASPDFDTLNNQEYFAAFTTNKGDGYIGNNFGQDLRNFKSFLNYARSKGATTVYFRYG